MYPLVTPKRDLFSSADPFADLPCETRTEKLCDFLESGGQFFQLTKTWDDNEIFLAFTVISATINACFFFLMWRIKEL